MTLHLPAELQAQLEAIGRETGRTPETLALDAVAAFAEDQAAFIASIKAGAAQLERGESVPHAQLMTELQQLIAAKRSSQ